MAVKGKEFSTSPELLKTCFHDLHVSLNATMVPFAGYSMPVLYKAHTHLASHKWTRTNAGLFDVSHMLQHKFSGPDAVKLLEIVTPGDIQGLSDFNSTLSVLLNDKGGIIDDTIITRWDKDTFYVVTNAGCRDKDLAFLKSEIQKNGLSVNHEIIYGGLLALQGPKAAQTLQQFTSADLSKLTFGSSTFLNLGSFGDVHVARGGYTGEDGFEISITDPKAAVDFAKALIEEKSDTVIPVGLAARDSLRLEAGMCLYGHELNESITPIEAGLAWVIGKNRRQLGDSAANFNGAQTILSQLNNKKELVFKTRIGFTSKGPAARENCDIFVRDEKVGIVTSGSPSPSLGGNIGMAYINKPYNKIGTDITILVRGKPRSATVAKMPFLQPNYYRG
ncbi:aminomethyltransferase [Nadsonia fulvescens var. elongata DSM 6958]|uniref:Aminomethyltransferase n=1 Tax=Nadsonia fulvescens var. elongata DSM 6958 TaxID=857566 RepID=A0A1E3PPF9_9ASCO|nr:aminomethyltransferase [Nadsonia fulvescens var. elongata DSM 6958]